jgi:hypothetical protein
MVPGLSLPCASGRGEGRCNLFIGGRGGNISSVRVYVENIATFDEA